MAPYQFLDAYKITLTCLISTGDSFPRRFAHTFFAAVLIRPFLSASGVSATKHNVKNGATVNRVRCTIKRSHSTPCKKPEFEHLQIFPGHCFDFFLPVSGKICHSPIKKVKRQPTLIISFSQHSPFFEEQSKNPG